ncbi:C6orf136 protein [Plakobranchus ocellatus]|uniref:C6orf136 protein n=1 Tax=Plakobranchus ocellatus TaxID=259542 RepID=A0AAV4DP90_9GAST|nr:C6orf136 protein [Plakobranchus ocellatus]
MAYHFRKLKNTLRLFPSTKTIGFSTRLNEGDSHNLNTIPDGNVVTSSLGACNSFYGLLKNTKDVDFCSTESSPNLNISQSDSALANHFLPALISSSGNVLPVSYNDLAQILRLPPSPPHTCCDIQDLSSDVASVLKVIHPTSDDILAESEKRSPGLEDPKDRFWNDNSSHFEMDHVCKLFSGRQDYSILHKNVVLENNLFGDNKTAVGMLAYGIEILKLRLRIHARFSSTSVELQSVTMLEQSGVIRIHWRLRGLSQLQTLKFWRLFQRGNPVTKDDYEWLEAFSYFHIGKDGLVHKHRIDRVSLMS